MGLSDRAALVFGGNLLASQPARVPPEDGRLVGEPHEAPPVAAPAWLEVPR
jgi:hypothetical protein